MYLDYNALSISKQVTSDERTKDDGELQRYLSKPKLSWTKSYVRNRQIFDVDRLNVLIFLNGLI
jgi:hypothetical protein